MPSNHVCLIPLTACMAMFALVSPSPCLADENSFAGTWAFSLADNYPAWLRVTDASGELSVDLLWSVGSARPAKHVQLMSDGRLRFQRNIKYRPYGRSEAWLIEQPFTATLSDDRMELTFQQRRADSAEVAAQSLTLIGKRMPPLPAAPDLSKIRFGEPIVLMNGRNLDGWSLTDPNKKNGWSVANGELVNSTPKDDFGAYGQYGNLRSTREFEDFQLTIDYNVPKNGNSGVYLRGMYEAQVVDRDSRMQGIQGPGAVFGRIAPTENAGLEGGRWNRYVLTLVDRHVTIVLNGKRVVDNEPLIGCTGGGISADDTLPGPIFLQGDHTSVKYRSIVLRPVLDSSDPN